MTPPSTSSPYALGVEKVSITVTRKTRDDLIISQHSAERFFKHEDEAVSALRDILEATIKLNDTRRNEPLASEAGAPE